MFGRVESRWEREGDAYTLELTIPPNTTAAVHIPSNDPASVHEGGRIAAGAPGVKLTSSGADGQIYDIGSGRYAFTWTSPSQTK